MKMNLYMSNGFISIIILLLRVSSINCRVTVQEDAELEQNNSQQYNIRRTAADESQSGLYEQFMKWIDNLRRKNQSSYEPSTALPTRTPPLAPKPSSRPITKPRKANAPAISTASSLIKPSGMNNDVSSQTKRCGCDTCTDTVWNTLADQFTCGSRIFYLLAAQPVLYPTEELACQQISGIEFPQVCGACNPTTCNEYSIPSDSAISTDQCGCKSCTDDILERNADGYTCQDRINWVRAFDQTVMGSEFFACRVVAQQFPSICGPECNPYLCAGSILIQPPVVSPTIAPVSPPIIISLPITSSPISPPMISPPISISIPSPVSLPIASPPGVSPPITVSVSSPDIITPPSPFVIHITPTMKVNCGCTVCTEVSLSQIAEGYTCGARIDWVKANDPTAKGLEIEACRIISNQFPTICGITCNPDKCSDTLPIPPQVNNNPPKPLLPVVSSTTGNTAVSNDIYCFPPEGNRKRYTNVWGNYIIDVKENNGLCGPGDNKFAKDTVSLSNDELKLQFKMINGVWTGSEVRLAVPTSNEPFTYGTYSFSVKSVSFQRNNIEIMKDLPPSLILGLFTWDPTDDYAIHENWSHEVDIEISRWNDTTGMDGQFLVQPPGQPQMYRYYTGVGNTRSPGNNRYQFTWNPSEVKWYSTAGGGQSHSYTTKDAIDAGVDDFVQCLPANVEIRFNLWNMFGTQTPTDMKETDIVEVVIDDFKYTPSGLTGVKAGGYCTKNCQCESPLVCFSRTCTAA